MLIDHGNLSRAGHGTTLRDVKDAFTDWPKLVVVVFNLISTIPVSAFGVFLPQILQGKLCREGQ